MVIDGLIEEYHARKSEISEPFTTLYLGGGTPSLLSEQQLARLLGGIDLSANPNINEVTLEANPDDITLDKTTAWRGMGINRISIGVQSLDDAQLQWMGRRHNAKQAIDAIRILQNVGFENISADLIYGLPAIPSARSSSFPYSVRTLLDTGITHLSAYCLTFHEGTRLFDMLKAGKVCETSDEEIAEQYDTLRRITGEYGFEHYEISNFARQGYRSRHNCTYWKSTGAWLGIGPSAHSFDGKTRRIDISDTARWCQSLPSPYIVEEESAADRINDFIVTALRTIEGLDLSSMPDLSETILSAARPFVHQGSMTLQDNHLAIRPEKWLIADSFIRELLIL